MSRHPVSKETVTGRKSPKAIVNVEGSFDKSPSWRFSSADNDHERWSLLDSNPDVVYDPDDPTGTKIVHTFSQSIDRQLLDGLKSREDMTWSQLFSQIGGRNSGTNNHHIPIYQLVKEARDRVTELDITADELFSLRLDGKKRVWGILEEGVLSIIWFDRDHEICPSPKR